MKERFCGARRTLPGLLILAAFAMAASNAAWAFEEPDGFGKAKFGMTEAQLRAAYPKAAKLAGTATPPPGQPEAPFTLAFYDLDGQKVGPLQHCHVQFRFFQGELYDIQFRCPDTEKTTEYLKKRFGLPTRVEDKQLLWTGTKASVTHTTTAGVFSFGDVERTRSQTMTMLVYLSRVQAQATAAAATPTPPAPANQP